MARSVTEFLMECGFDVKPLKNGRFRATKHFNEKVSLKIGWNGYYYYCNGRGNTAISDMCAVCADTFPVMLELAYDRFHDSIGAFRNVCKTADALRRFEDEITSMFDRIMGGWE